MKRLFTISIFTIISCFIYAQGNHSCGWEINRGIIKNDPNKYVKLEKQLQQIISYQKVKKTSNDVYTIPVVIHVIHNGEAVGTGNNISEAQILSGMQQLNDAFSNKDGNGIDTKIRFQLATQDPNCQATTGIVRVDGSGVSGYSTHGVKLGTSNGADELTIKGLSYWSRDSYYNIWLISEIDGNDGGFGTQGFALFPGGSAARDGAMIMNTAWGDQGTANSWNNQGKTGIHELGHALNLYHTFEGDEDGGGNRICPTDPNGCGSDKGDCCSDTEIHKRNASVCPSGTNECTSQAWAGVQNNYMDYSSQNCQFTFTNEQITRMRATLEGTRSSLLTSKGLDTPVGFTAPSASTCTPQTQSDGSNLGMDRLVCAITNVQLGSLNYASSYPSVDAPSTSGYVDKSGDCLLGVQLTEGTTQKLKFTVGVNTNRVSAWIDYNNNNTFESGELIGSKTGVASKTTDSITFVVPTNATEQTFLRMRIIVDLVAISGPCHNPTYGQAEDYSVYIKPESVAPVAAFTANKTSVCAGDSITFTDQSTNTPTSWSWNITGAASLSSTDQNPKLKFATAGTYNVTLTASNGAGSDDEVKSTYITVHPKPTFSLGNDTALCPGKSAIVLDAGSWSAYSWVDGFSSQQTMQLMVPGNVWCEVTDANGCKASDTIVYNSSSLNVTSDKNFDSTYYDSDPLVTLAFGSPSGGTYSGTAVSSGKFDPVTAGAGDHKLKYLVVDQYGCKDSVEMTFEVSLSVGLEDKLGIKNLKVSPNPTDGNFAISFENPNRTTYNYSLKDSQGKIVFEGTFNSGSQINQVFNIQGKSNGLYYLNLYSKQNQSTITILKK